MNRTVTIGGVILFLAGGIAVAQEAQQPATDATVQATAQGQASATGHGQGATDATGAADAQAGGSSASLAQGTEISATLTSPVDAGEAKPGDPVEARTTKDIRSSDGEVVVPRGSRLVGRVTKAERHGSGSSQDGTAADGSTRGHAGSQLAVVFERAILDDGSSVALNGALTALGAARVAPSQGGQAAGAGSVAGSATGSGGGVAGAVGGTVGGVTRVTAGTAAGVGAAVGGSASTVARSAGAVGGYDVGGNLQSGSRGVFGLRHLQIEGATQGGIEGSVISSTQRTVRLESGMQMLIVAGASSAEKAAGSGDGTPPAGPPAREPREDRR